MLLKDRVVLVTGGNSGIGRSIVLRCAAEGARVVIAARDADRGRETVEAVSGAGGSAVFLQVDLVEEGQVRGLIEAVLDRHGRLDVVVNNAGAGARRSGVRGDDSPRARWDKLVGANFLTAYLVSAHALPALQAGGGGAIVNISSTAAVHGNYGLYGAAKAGVEGLTRGLAMEGAPHGIRVNCVSPGWIRTEATYPRDEPDQEEFARRRAWEREASPLARMGDPDEVARAVVFLASNQASFITGAVLMVDGGLTLVDATADAWLKTMDPEVFSTGSDPEEGAKDA